MNKSKQGTPTGAARPAGRGSDGPLRYRIVVGKPLSPTWSDRLAGMVITPVGKHPSQAPTTKLEGMVQDQAQLLGLLNTLYDMGLPLLRVKTLEE